MKTIEDIKEVKVFKLDNMNIKNEYCIYEGKYFKINKINEETGIMICRNMSNVSQKVKIHKSQVEFIEKSKVPQLFR